MSAGQRASVEGVRLCFSTVQNNWPGVSEPFDLTQHISRVLMSDELPNTSVSRVKCQELFKKLQINSRKIKSVKMNV